MDDRARERLIAWLDFYRELGIAELRMEREASGPAGTAGTASVPDHLPSIRPVSVAPEAGQELKPAAPPRSSTQEVPSFVAPRGASVRPLSLFEAAPPPSLEKETLEQIQTDLGDCHRCQLAGGRKKIVFGEGNPHAAVVFIGEGPGADEDEQGLPFVGRAGRLLNRMLQLVGMRREDVYICNVVKCRPPGNRTPMPDEIETCSPFLFRQIEAIRPRLVVCLGAPAVRTVLGVKEGITKIRGRIYEYGGAKALATVHPAYVLRNPREEKILREDFEKIRDFLEASA